MTTDEAIDTRNMQLVGSQGEDIVLLLPKQRMTKSEALVHAAWLVTLADDEDRFSTILEAVHNT